MKHAVSISIGSSKRDKSVDVELLGEQVRIERIGTNGSMEKAAQLYKELDGKVDAFGVGGADLGEMVDTKWYPLYSVQPMVRFIKQTPVVDGAGYKNTLENRIVPFMNEKIGGYIKEKKVLLTGGADRWGMTMSFTNGGYECVFGDLMFALGLPIPIRSIAAVKSRILCARAERIAAVDVVDRNHRIAGLGGRKKSHVRAVEKHPEDVVEFSIGKLAVFLGGKHAAE